MRLHPSVSVVLLACAVPALAEPAGLLQATDDCLNAWKPEFEAGYGIKPDAWKEGCAMGLTPMQMLDLAEKKLTEVPLPAPPPAAVPTGKLASLDKTVAGLGDVNATQGSEALFGEKKKQIDTGIEEDQLLDLTITPKPQKGYLGPKFQGQKPDVDALIAGAPKKIPVKPPPPPDRTLAANKGPAWFETLTSVVGSGYVPYGKAMTEYLKITGLKNYAGVQDVGWKNEGVDRFFAGMAEKDPAYAARVEEFYAKVAAFDAENQKFPNLKPNLGQAAGAGRLSYVEPGWAWKAALEVAKGDPDEAMRLIGFCGHDDVARGGYVNATGQRVNPCPGSRSLFYLPGSLGADADVDPDMKAAVALSEKGSETKLARIPAKHYHVLGAAAVACELIRNGAPAGLAVTVQTNAGKAYRSMRLKADAETMAGYRERITKDYADYKKRLPDALTPRDEETFRALWIEKDPTRRETYTADLLRQMDAHELMEHWGLGLRLSGQFYPADISFGVPHARPKGWSDARLEAAEKTMEGMFVEQRWTTAEHQAGARFAAKVCKEKKI